MLVRPDKGLRHSVNIQSTRAGTSRVARTPSRETPPFFGQISLIRSHPASARGSSHNCAPKRACARAKQLPSRAPALRRSRTRQRPRSGSPGSVYALVRQGQCEPTVSTPDLTEGPSTGRGITGSNHLTNFISQPEPRSRSANVKSRHDSVS